MVKQRIAIIPARGGSKRIPHKNITEFCAKPMIAWTIQAAKESGLFDRILVSTDDQSIAEVSKTWGAEVPFLRASYSDDHAPVSEATVSALQQAMNHWQESYASVIQLMANCPLLTADDITQAVTQFEAQDRSFQISCFKYGWMNPWWAVKLDTEGHPERLFPETAGQRSQDLPELFCPTGAIWIAKADMLLKTKTFYGPNHVFEPMLWESGVDIDDYDDMRFAEALSQRVSVKK